MKFVFVFLQRISILRAQNQLKTKDALLSQRKRHASVSDQDSDDDLVLDSNARRFL